VVGLLAIQEGTVTRRVHFSIAGLMGAVVVVAVGLAALRDGSRTSAALTFMVIWGTLCLALVGALCRRGIERTWWLGFAIFGYAYLAVIFWWHVHLPEMVTIPLLEALLNALGPRRGELAWDLRAELIEYRIGHCLVALAVAIMGGLASVLIWRVPADRMENPIAGTTEAEPSPRMWWWKPAAFGLTGLGLATVLAVIGPRWAPGLWAGSMFLLTCGLLGIAALGSLFGRGKRRVAWMGATLFGVGYMALTFGGYQYEQPWLRRPIDYFLEISRPANFRLRIDQTRAQWSNPPDQPSADRTALILEALARPAEMPFPNETPLEDFIEYVKRTTVREGLPEGIPIYVDPNGLQEAEKGPRSLIQIDLKGVTLNESLRLVLRQLSLAHSVCNGYLLITAEAADWPFDEDPFLIVGHCMIAVVGAFLGGVLAPLISDADTRPRGQPAKS
jgi:hypothetical protein